LQQNQALEEAAGHITRLEGELSTTQRESAAVIAGLEADLARQVAWGEEQEGRLNAHIATLDARIAEAAQQLAAYQAKVDELENTLIERTVWAQTEQSQREAAEAKLSAVEASRWIRMGKAFGLGPKF
jgi:flagellar biosynthesis chaperone FliJ